VAFCAFCASQLHISTYKSSSGRQFRYYQCSEARRQRCQAGRVPADYLEGLAAQLFLQLVGSQEILERIDIPADDHQAEMTAIEEAMHHLEEQYATGSVYQGAEGAERFAGLMTRLEERLDRLRGLPSTPAQVDYRSTGRTFADKWREESKVGRRQLMVNAGFQVRIARTVIAPADVAAEAHQQGITASARELRNRAANIKYMATKTTKPERLAVLAYELAAVEAERRRLRDMRRYNEVVSFALDEDLARRAGLAAAGKPVEIPDLTQAWDQALAPLLATFRNA
jgi:hypothetical protein